MESLVQPCAGWTLLSWQELFSRCTSCPLGGANCCDVIFSDSAVGRLLGPSGSVFLQPPLVSSVCHPAEERRQLLCRVSGHYLIKYCDTVVILSDQSVVGRVFMSPYSFGSAVLQPHRGNTQRTSTSFIIQDFPLMQNQSRRITTYYSFQSLATRHTFSEYTFITQK